jgi:hypothetical protein
LAAVQLRRARYGNVKEGCHSGGEIRRPSRDAAAPRPRLNRQPDGAYEGRLKRMNRGDDLAAALQSVVYRTNRPENQLFEKTSITKMIKNQWLTD